MALIACPECGKEISDKAPACPHCGAPAIRATPERDQYEAVFPTEKKPTSPWPAILSVAVMAAITYACVGAGKAPTGERGFDHSDAILLCQKALKNAARDPEKADVPYVPNQGSGDNFYFIWGGATKMARMRNGFGLEVATTASCTVSATQKRITSLILDGKAII